MFLSQNIKHLYKKLNLSQDEFGAMFDLNTGAIAKYTSNKALPKLETIVKICTYFEITIDQFVQLDLSKGYLTNQNEFVNKAVADGLKYITVLEEKTKLLENNNAVLKKSNEYLEQLLMICRDEKKSIQDRATNVS